MFCINFSEDNDATEVTDDGLEQNASSFSHKVQTELSPVSNQDAENPMTSTSNDKDDFGSNYGHKSPDKNSQAPPYSAITDFLKAHLRHVR